MEQAYVVIDKNLGCRVLRFSPEGSYVTKVLVKKTEKSLHHQFNGGVCEQDVLYSKERGENFEIIKMNAIF